MTAIRSVSDELFNDHWKQALEKFITHYVWHSQDRRNNQEPTIHVPSQVPYWFRLEGRLTEMQERRRRLIKYLYKKEGRLHEFEEGYKQSIAKKSTIIKKFTSIQLEDLLRTSTKNVAQEVVSSLIPSNGGMGVLADIERTLSQSASAIKRGSTRRIEEGDYYNALSGDDGSSRGGAAGNSAAGR